MFGVGADVNVHHLLGPGRHLVAKAQSMLPCVAGLRQVSGKRQAATGHGENVNAPREEYHIVARGTEIAVHHITVGSVHLKPHN
jgi:hypothetical protein